MRTAIFIIHPKADPASARNRDGAGEGIRPLSPGWATRVGKQGCNNGHGKDEGRDGPTDPVKRDRPAGMDGGRDGGAGAASSGACGDKGAALRAGGRHSSTPVLGRSPLTAGAKAEEKVRGPGGPYC